jgi:ATP-dependent protease ClpP protease subunit
LPDNEDPRLIEARIALMQAETQKYRMEAWAAEEQARLTSHEARQKLAHAISAEYGATSMRIQTEATERQEKLALASNHHHHVYEFLGGVNDDTVDQCLAQLAIWDRLEPTCDMKVVIHSPGGGVLAGLHLFDEIDRYSLRGGGHHKTTGEVRGWAASMGGILLQAFDERVIGKNATLMIHEVSSWAQGKVGDIEDELTFLKQLSRQVAEKFVERSDGKITLEDFETKWHRREWYLNSAETIALGFADRIG